MLESFMIFKLSDLSFLKKKLFNTQIIMLGEPDHGAGRAFEIKTELIKYLYNELGFRVLAFEADFHAGVMQKEKFTDCLYDFWSPRIDSMENFYNWYRGLPGGDPLHLCGFDCRRAYKLKEFYRSGAYRNKLLGNIKSDNFSNVELSKFSRILDELLIYEYKSQAVIEDKEYFFKALDMMDTTDIFWKQEIENLKGYAFNAWYPDMNSSKFRDGQMASNISWLAEKKYPNEKIIIWAHNYHILKDCSEVVCNESRSDIGFLMGEILHKKYKKKICSIGIAGFKGAYSYEAYLGSYDKVKEINYDISDCFENSLLSKDCDEYYLDLTQDNIHPSKFKSSALNLNYPQDADWKKVYDGIIFTKKMTGLKILN